tara:strand:+ start:757 stop:1077 length:321 start_codon:yes stop_codon:yes gene_type:complete
MAKSKINYKWDVKALDAKIQEDNKDNVIYNIHWGYSASRSDNSVSMIGTYSVSYDKDNFIEYEELKESDVIGWLEAGLDVTAMKQNLSDQLSLVENPTDVVLRPNW